MKMNYLFHLDPCDVADAGDEIAIQTRLRSRMKMLAPTVRLVAVPNGMRTSAWGAVKAKREGMSAGFPDLVAIARPRLVAFLEIKTKVGGLSGDQVNWLNFLTSAGFQCGCFRSVDTAIAALRQWGFPFVDDQAVPA